MRWDLHICIMKIACYFFNYSQIKVIFVFSYFEICINQVKISKLKILIHVDMKFHSRFFLSIKSFFYIRFITIYRYPLQFIVTPGKE